MKGLLGKLFGNSKTAEIKQETERPQQIARLYGDFRAYLEKLRMAGEGDLLVAGTLCIIMAYDDTGRILPREIYDNTIEILSKRTSKQEREAVCEETIEILTKQAKKYFRRAA